MKPTYRLVSCCTILGTVPSLISVSIRVHSPRARIFPLAGLTLIIMREFHPPVLSLRGLWGESVSSSALDVAAARFDVAMRTHGVLYIEDCGLSDELVSRLRRKAVQFFQTGKIDKSDSDTYGAEGYTGIGRETVGTSHTNQVATRDIVESLVLFSADSVACPDELRDDVRQYLQHSKRISLLLVRLMAHALNEPKVIDMFDGEEYPLKIAHYPAAVSGTQGYGAHTDYGSFTLLAQEYGDAFPAQGSLQAFVDNTWCVVPPRKGALLVNSADLIERLTNGVYKTPLHRVVLAENRTQSRLSIVLFTAPKRNVKVAPLEKCCSKLSPAKYEPVIAHEFVQRKLQRNNGIATSLAS